MEGYYDKVFGAQAEVIMTDLTFKTNKGTSQPFGLAGGEFFELKEEGSMQKLMIWFIRSESMLCPLSPTKDLFFSLRFPLDSVK